MEDISTFTITQREKYGKEYQSGITIGKKHVTENKTITVSVTSEKVSARNAPGEEVLEEK
jgi:hypothetical protein